MKNLFIILAISLIISPKISFAQVGEAIKYEYDGAGKRIKRYYDPAAVLNKHGDTLTENSPADKLIRDKGISKLKDTILLKAYPNPTSDELIVENLSWKDDFNKATVKIFDITGKLIQSRTLNEARGQFSLSSLVPGIYQVHYYLDNDLLTTWKIIKK
jgi:hypothetical protein